MSRSEKAARLDVLSGLGKTTLDVIGLAGASLRKRFLFTPHCRILGFGYTFDSLRTAKHGSSEREDELAQAFDVIFSAARKFRAINILMVWFPFLRRFVRHLYS